MVYNFPEVADLLKLHDLTETSGECVAIREYPSPHFLSILRNDICVIRIRQGAGTIVLHMRMIAAARHLWRGGRQQKQFAERGSLSSCPRPSKCSQPRSRMPARHSSSATPAASRSN